MTDLAIKRYQLVLARSGGHSWGPDRERVFAAAQRALPSRIAEALAARLPDDLDLEITEPLRLSLRLSLADLTSACAFEDGLGILAQRIVASWEPPDDVVRRRASTPAGSNERRADGEAPATDSPTTSPMHRVADSPLDAARAWLASGELDAILGALSTSALRSWLAAILDESQSLAYRGIEAFERARVERSTGISEPAELRASIAAVVRAVVHDPHTEPSAAVRPDENVDALLVARAASFAAISVPPRSERGQAAWRAPATTTTIDGLALPFLLLRSLAQIGYLDALAASCAALGQEAVLPAIARVLATHVLPEPGRGWQHAPIAASTATAFSGGEAVGIGDAVEVLAPAERIAARAVLAGHASHRPLLLHRHGSTLVLAEPDGLLPIAWSARIDELLAPAIPITVPIAVTAKAADAELLAALDARGLRFVTNAPPARGETWRRLAAVRVWTNDRSTADPSLAASLSTFALVDDLDELLTTLAVRHPRDVSPRIARSLATAAAIALGDLAHRLWHDREPTSPQLALARFADLSARITTSPEAVEVRIPRGARHRDLERAGFLGIRRAPWLGDRVITIGVQ